MLYRASPSIYGLSMDIIIIVVPLVVFIALFRVQDAYKAHGKSKHPGDQPGKAGLVYVVSGKC